MARQVRSEDSKEVSHVGLKAHDHASNHKLEEGRYIQIGASRCFTLLVFGSLMYLVNTWLDMFCI